MADRSIMVQDLFANQNVKVNTLTPIRGINQLPGATVIMKEKWCRKEYMLRGSLDWPRPIKSFKGNSKAIKLPWQDGCVFHCISKFMKLIFMLKVHRGES
uniref:Putative LOC100637207 [Amphimedon queenslandica] n=1 Tax=Lepeophtheirus salmonis TaxID=72036 RepID=A0A0K2UQR7_LEPSM